MNDNHSYQRGSAIARKTPRLAPTRKAEAPRDAAATASAAATRPGSRVEAAGARAGSAARARRAQNERRSASSIWREGALMFAASERSSTPKLAELRFPIGTSKLARSKAFSTWNTASIP